MALIDAHEFYYYPENLSDEEGWPMTAVKEDNKGNRKMIATKDIKAHTLIGYSYPLIVLPGASKEWGKLAKGLLSKYPDVRLPDLHPRSANIPVLKSIMLKIIINSFAGDTDGGNRCAYRMISMINHSCQPNAYMHRHCLCGMITALVDIKAGEEVTISYQTIDDKKMRMQELKNQFMWDKLECQCGKCDTKTKQHVDINLAKRNRICTACKKQPEKIAKCKFCDIRYCNRKCQLLDFTHHRKICGTGRLLFRPEAELKKVKEHLAKCRTNTGEQLRSDRLIQKINREIDNQIDSDDPSGLIIINRLYRELGLDFGTMLR